MKRKGKAKKSGKGELVDGDPSLAMREGLAKGSEGKKILTGVFSPLLLHRR